MTVDLSRSMLLVVGVGGVEEDEGAGEEEEDEAVSINRFNRVLKIFVIVIRRLWPRP